MVDYDTDYEPVETYELFDSIDHQRRDSWRWFGYDDEDPGDVSVDSTGRIWVPTYCQVTDAIRGSHVVDRLPASERYGWQVRRWMWENRWHEEQLARVCDDCGRARRDCACPF